MMSYLFPITACIALIFRNDAETPENFLLSICIIFVSFFQGCLIDKYIEMRRKNE